MKQIQRLIAIGGGGFTHKIDPEVEDFIVAVAIKGLDMQVAGGSPLSDDVAGLLLHSPRRAAAAALPTQCQGGATRADTPRSPLLLTLRRAGPSGQSPA